MASCEAFDGPKVGSDYRLDRTLDALRFDEPIDQQDARVDQDARWVIIASSCR